MTAAGTPDSLDTVRRLTPALLRWPDESGHQRALQPPPLGAVAGQRR
jgi:hypothetical protein